LKIWQMEGMSKFEFLKMVYGFKNF
jgi:hypothetical protein